MTTNDLSVEHFMKQIQQLTPIEVMAVALVIEGLHNHPSGWKPPVDLVDLSPADEKVLGLVRLLALHPHWNRDHHGRFRKMPTQSQIFAESLAIAKGAHEFRGEAEQGVIERWVMVLGAPDAGRLS